jgi:hypothetical protein
MGNYKKEALEYLLKLENLCEWLEFVKHKSSRDEFVKAGIITRGELRHPKFLRLRKGIVFWKGTQGWTRYKDWKIALENKRQEINELEEDVE